MKEWERGSSPQEVSKVTKVSKGLLKLQMLQLPEDRTHCKKLSSQERAGQKRTK
jgi:hypothetical protein